MVVTKTIPRRAVIGLLFALALPGFGAQSPFPENWTPQNPRYVFQSVPDRFDIGTVTVTSLAQDKTGFLWIGTQQGVLRYDGGRIVRFGRADGLPTLFIDQLEAGSDGAIWVGTNEGIARYNGTKFERITIPVPGARTDSNYQIVAPDHTHGAYVATSLGLLWLDGTDPARFKLWTRKDGLLSDAVEAVFVTPSGVLYFVCGNRVGRLRDPGSKPEILSPPISDSATDRKIAILVDAQGVTWVRTARHVLRVDPGGSGFLPDDEGIPMANDFGVPVLDGSGQLMVPTVRGLFRRNHGQWEQVGARQGMDSDAVFAAREDREGAIWVGYGGSGAARWPGAHNWSAWTKSEGLPDSVVWCELRDGLGRLWVGTDNGLAMWEPGSHRWRTWTVRDGLAGSTVRQLEQGRDGAIWTVSIPGGVTRIDGRTLAAVKTSMPGGADDPAGIAIAADGRVWAGNYRSLKIISVLGNGVPVQDVPVPLAAYGTTSHPAFAPDGTLWTGGRAGISRFDGKTWSVYTTSNGLRSNAVPAILPVSGREVWFRYLEPLGLGHLQMTERGVEVKHVTSKDGLASDGVFLLGKDQSGRIWVGGNEGLSAVESTSGRVRSFSRGDGLIWNDLSGGGLWADPDGSLYFGTSRGLARFESGPAGLWADSAHVLLTSATLGDKERLNYKDPSTDSGSSFTAQFADLSFRDAERTPCRYRLEGIESATTETLQRQVRYAALPSGNYRFQVSCLESGGSWTTPAVYAFTVDPAWWEQLWARALGLLLLGTLIAATIRFRTRTLEADRRRLEEAVAARSAELAKANRELEEAAITDPLTKAYNRRYFQLSVEVDAQRALRSYFDRRADSRREDVVFFLVDVDHFKQVNDTFGHSCGDRVLQCVAERLRRTIRASDTLIRWGGEEFLVVTRGTRREDVAELGKRILDAVGGQPFEGEPGHFLRCTCSVGWAAFPWDRAEPYSHGLAEVVQFVDEALYMAKHAGRNQCVGVAPGHPSGDGEMATMKLECVRLVRTLGPTLANL
jgi:diguanylate cyclase (GGDEF)-like protein